MSVSQLLSNVQVTGSNVIYNANFTGIGGAQVFVSGNTVFVSGGAGGSGSSGGGGTNTTVNGLTGSINITGAGGVTVSTAGQNIIVSGREGGTFLTFLSPIPTGIDAYFIQYPNTVYSTPPIVNFVLETQQSNLGYFAAISGRSTSGFWALFSDTILEDQFYLNVFVQDNPLSIGFITGLVTGFDKYLISYPNFVFPTVPYVMITPELDGSSNFYGAVISGRSVNSFYILTSDIITDSGIYFNVFAKS